MSGPVSSSGSDRAAAAAAESAAAYEKYVRASAAPDDETPSAEEQRVHGAPEAGVHRAPGSNGAAGAPQTDPVPAGSAPASGGSDGGGILGFLRRLFGGR